MTVTVPAAVPGAHRRPAQRRGKRTFVGARARRVGMILAATLLALGAVLVPAAQPTVRAAEDSLDLQTATTYRVSPADRAVHVSISLTARNNKPNKVSGGILTRYFYDGARLGIHPEARNIAARDGGVRLTTTTSKADGYVLLDVRFRRSLFFHQTATIRITYDLPSGKPRSASDVRVGVAFVTFVAWAFGDRGSVRVEVPAAFQVTTTGSTAARSSAGSMTVFRATNIRDTNAWYLVVTADRESALTRERVDLADGEHLVVRAWPEDRDWIGRVRDVLSRGLPELIAATGLDWPITGDIAVFEVHTPLLEGYAGVFFSGRNRIEISEDLDDLTILHEASHAWFNERLFVARWIDEGLADAYAATALQAIHAGTFTPDRVSPTDTAAVRLDLWVHPGRITDDATDAREQYGYNASWTVIRSLLTEIGVPGMQRVLGAAEARTIAYVGDGPAETVGVPSDWRRFLDLLEEVGGSATAEDLFRRWVLTDRQVALLEPRATARTAYEKLVGAGGSGWAPPRFVRDPMAAWRFDEAGTRIEEATAVLATRDEIARLAARLGLTPGDGLQRAYRDATDSLDDAGSIAQRQLAAARALAVATDAVAAPRAPYVTIGLIGETPEAALAAAREAFVADAPDAEARATAVTRLMDGAVAVGRSRLIGLAIGIAIATLAAIAAVLVILRRRRRRVSTAEAVPVTADGSALAEAPAEAPARSPSAEVGPAPYATLADPIPDPASEPASGPPPSEPTPDEPTPDGPPKPRRRARRRSTPGGDAS